MANQENINNLEKGLDALDELDNERLYRRTLGEESLETELSPLLSEISSKANLALQQAPNLPNTVVDQFTAQLRQITNQSQAQSERENQEYIAEKNNYLTQVRDQLESMRASWPAVVAAAIVSRGLLDDEGIKQQYNSTLDAMRIEGQKLVEDLKKESSKAIDEAKEQASAIEARARRTAGGISVKAAQDQFEAAQWPLIWQLLIWGALSAGSLYFFYEVWSDFMSPEFDSEDKSLLIYYTALRIAALTIVGSFCAYCLRILRSQLHMFQKNLHRRRVVNCIEALVESAQTPEQQDAVYVKLVESVTDFGDSGLLPNRESTDSGNRLTIENMFPSISSKSE